LGEYQEGAEERGRERKFEEGKGVSYKRGQGGLSRRDDVREISNEASTSAPTHATIK